MTKKLDVRLPADMHEAVDALAEKRRQERNAVTPNAGEIVREALAFYFGEVHQVPLSAEVEWGGDRRKQHDLATA